METLIVDLIRQGLIGILHGTNSLINAKLKSILENNNFEGYIGCNNYSTYQQISIIYYDRKEKVYSNYYINSVSISTYNTIKSEWYPNSILLTPQQIIKLINEQL